MTAARSQAGFTLVELLVTMAMALIVFAATLNVLDVFSSDSQAMTQRNTAQNEARLGMDRIVRQLRNIASPVTQPKLLERAQPYDIVFQTIGTPSGANVQGTERVRYCIPPDTTPGTPSDEVLISQTMTWNTTDPSDLMFSTACPDPAYPSVVVASGVTNRYQGEDRPAFTFTGGSDTDLSTIDSVQLDLFVNPTPRLADAETELRSGAFLRNQQRPPVEDFTYTVLGGGAVLLNAGTSYDPSGESLSYKWTCAPTACSSSAAIFSWHPGPGTYQVTLQVTDQSGLQSPAEVMQVTVT